MHVLKTFCILSLLIASQSLSATNLARENQIEMELRKDVIEGEIITLGPDQKSFVGIYSRSTLPFKQGGVILLHDLGKNPDSPEIIRPLRTRLVEHGWDTLSIQMPVAGKFSHRKTYDSMIPEAIDRINEAVSFFTQKNNFNLGIVAHGHGAATGAHYLATTPLEVVGGMIAISMDLETPHSEDDLKKIKVPFIDIYGELDLNSVTKSASDRKRAVSFNAANLKYRQIRKTGADHFFTGLEDSLFVTVRNWLAKNVAGEEVILKQDESAGN